MKKGFTLIEIIIVVGILALILFSISSFQVNILQYNKYSSDSLQSAQDAKAILKVIIKELRSAKQSNNGSYPIAQAATSSITFYSDIDADGIQEQIRYFLSSVTLKKGIIIPTGSPLTYNPAQEKISTLAYSVKNTSANSLFEYFDNTYAGTSSPLVMPVTISSIRLVRVNIMIDADPNRSPIPRTFTSQAMLRNLKDNL